MKRLKNLLHGEDEVLSLPFCFRFCRPHGLRDQMAGSAFDDRNLELTVSGRLYGSPLSYH